jgi:hypothetical protein
LDEQVVAVLQKRFVGVGTHVGAFGDFPEAVQVELALERGVLL